MEPLLRSLPHSGAPSAPDPGSFKEYSKGKGRVYNCPTCAEIKRQRALQKAAALAAVEAAAAAPMQVERQQQQQQQQQAEQHEQPGVEQQQQQGDAEPMQT